QPLKIVEEQRQRMLRPGEHSDEATEHELEPSARLLWRKFGNRRLLVNDEVQFGDEVGHEPAVRPQRLQNILAPSSQLHFGLTEERPHQTLKSLRKGRIGNVAFVLVELARGKEAARRHKRLVQLIDD